MPYLKNTWYVAAWDHEVSSSNLFHRILLGESILLFRDSKNTVQAIINRCVHRFAPLHMGQRVGDNVQCRYHGLEFNGRGQCVHNPHGDGAIPKAAVVRSFPVHERHSAIWIWMGDPALANPDLIPDFSFNDPEANFVGKRYLLAKANYLLETDNIMDLSHIQYLHPGSLGSDNVATATIELKQDGDTIWSNRLVHGEILPDFLYRAFGLPQGAVVDRWIDVRWNAPANMALFTGAVATGTPRGKTGEISAAHLFTPESETTTHYWFSVALPRQTGEAGAELVEFNICGVTGPFTNEDLPMLEAQQQSMGNTDFWAMKPVLLPSDAPAIRARRAIDRMIADEQSAG
ncbi:aromatic ring-hydroxylating dioxygenase subunit alpha [Noviherbaspirillum sedimenti]|uniref:Aromatic ring-hydroxylating dioxygenase subunit alpha n=1 Tax=Noviherbaspirillum sedimenti TaxID=2320865 RepID=A0A3A3GBF6_9BURK|nr:aromatic ring-hydroxylating dioxygenase subunit alpha [Noviherbaspirillum sedimenti]RJG04002.1 aromatic ring-hydroxylating dioxygenase subunit alpha [Noviherbaspirillum sedimenti]